MLKYALVFWIVLGPALAEAATVDLAQAVAEAVAGRPLAVAARHQAEAAAAEVGEARSRFLPRLMLSEQLLWTNEPAGSLFISLNQQDLVVSQDADRYNFPPSRKDFETRLSLEQTLYDPDIGYGLARAQKGADAAEAEARWRAEEAGFAAFQAYLGVQRAAAALDWVRSSRREAEELRRLAAERQEAGVGLKAEVLRARVSVAEAERRLVTAENDLVIARRALALAMGRSGEDVEIAAPIDPARLRIGEETPPRERADLAALALAAEEAGLARRQSRAAYLPRLGLSASYALHDEEVPFGTDADAWSVRAGLTWELFDGFRRSFGEKGAAARQQAAEARRLEEVRQAGFQQEQAELRAGEAEKHLETTRQAVAEAEESHRLLLQRYEAGLTDLSDLLGAQAALDRARYDLVAAESRHLLALGNIRFQNGTFLKTLLPVKEETKP